MVFAIFVLKLLKPNPEIRETPVYPFRKAGSYRSSSPKIATPEAHQVPVTDLHPTAITSEVHGLGKCRENCWGFDHQIWWDRFCSMDW
jgi:hypothetical protein